MKKILSFIIGALALGSLTSCEDVPAPYELFSGDSEKEDVTSIYYTSSNLYTGWSLYAETPDQPWSQGSSYTQATGYQTWGGDAKSNKEVTGYLISPKFNTVAASGKVKMYFDHTLRYTNNVSNWKQYHKILITKDWDGDLNTFDKNNWTTIDYTPAASTYSDWTTYSSGDIQIPAEYVNVDGVYVAFYFHADASASTTWELLNFTIEEGEATASADTGNTDTGDDNQGAKGEAKGDGTKENPFNVAGIINFGSKLAADAQSSEVYFEGVVSSIKEISATYGNGSFYITEDGKSNDDQFYVFRCYDLGNVKFTDENAVKVGDKVVMYGPITNYKGNTLETVQNKSYIYSINGKTAEGSGDEPVVDDSYNNAATRAVDGATVIWTVDGVTAGSTVDELVLNTLGFENAAEVSTLTLDHCTVTLDKGENSNAPKYYTATNGVRLYANNTLSFAAAQPIAQIIFTCDSQGSTYYVGNDTSKSNVDGNTVLINNYSTTSGVQLRIKSIKIIYADASSNRK